MVSPFVGRSAEALEVAELLASANGEATALVIEGEPGIGKTTLWLDGLERARGQGLQVLSARSSAAESVLAYTALADLMAHVDSALWTDLPAPQHNGFEAALLSKSDAVAVDQRAVGAALVNVLERLSFESPVVVAVDDLQWLDASSAAAMAFAARRVSSRVAWLCTSRHEATNSTRWLELSRPNAVHRIRLAPLTIGELNDVLVAQLGKSVPRSRLLRIHQVSDGNPFYALELVRDLDQRGSGSRLRLPDSLVDLTLSRIRRVEIGAEDALLAIASLADPTVHSVARAVGVTPHSVVDMLAEAETQQVVVIEGTHVRFTHPLLAHAVHVGATAPRRRSMHRRLAEVVTEPELRARHLALADPAGEPRTLDALDAAAVIARTRGAPAAAAELLELAIDLGGASHSRRIELAQCLFDCGDLRRARETLEAAILDLQPGFHRAEALQRLAMVRLYDDSFHDAAELCGRALDDCPDESALRTSVLTTLAFAQLNTGRPDVALATAECAVASAERLGPSEPLGRALGMRAILRFMTGEGVDGDDLDRAVSLESPHAAVPVALRSTVQRALMLGWSGDPSGARDALAEISKRCEDLGEEGETMFLAFHLVVFDIWLADLSRATATADDAVNRARQIGGGAATFLASVLRGAVAAHRGLVEEARRHLDAGVAAGVGTGYVLMSSWAVAAQGFLELSLGEHAKALATLEPLLPMVLQQPRYTELIGTGFVPDAVEAMVNLGRYDDAVPLVVALEDNGARLDRAWMLAVGARCRALLSAARGDVTAGVAEAQNALGHHDRIAMPFERARTLLVLGRLQRRLRHWRPAHAALTEALAVFEELGTPLWAAQARTELDRGSAGRPRSPGLTPTERRVAELASDGMTNHAIAATLFVTQKTVEVNLSRIYRKLGVHSRIELFHVMNNGAGPDAPGNRLR